MLRSVTIAVLLFIPQLAISGSDPSYQWKTISTEHFSVHYYQGGESLARRIASIAEEAYRRCDDLLGLVPSEKVEIVLVDSIDATNGFTSVYPYNHITVLAYPPDPASELASYDDPYRSLIYHEYAHVIQMDQFSGLPAAINSVLGKTVLPNGAVPNWFAEGFATFIESAMTGGGRIRSSLYSMFLRTAALEDRLLGLDELTEPPLKMPRGTAPYLYGAYFFDFLARRFGHQKMTDFIRDYGQRVIPFALNHLARRHFGHDFLDLYEAFLAEVRDEATKTALRIRSQGLLEGELLTEDGEIKDFPTFAPDSEHIIFVNADGRSTPAIASINIHTKKQKDLYPCYGGCSGIFYDGDYIYTSHLEPYRTYSFYGDIYRIESATGQAERLSTKARAREPSPMSDGTIAFVSADFEKVAILALDPATGKIRTLLPWGQFQGIGTPRLIPFSRLLVFSGSRAGQWDLWTLDLQTGALERLTNDEALDRDPAPTPDGRFILFSSDREGIYDIFAIDLETRQTFRLTRVIGGAFRPAPSPDGKLVTYLSWSARGYDVAIIPFHLVPEQGKPETTPARPPYEPEPVSMFQKNYSPLPSLRPRALRPRYLFASNGIQRLGLELAGEDAVGHHKFSTVLESDTSAWNPTAVFSYSYERLFPTLQLNFGTAPAAIPVLADTRAATSTVRQYLLSFSISKPFPWRGRTFSFGLGYSLYWTSVVHISMPKDPAAAEPIVYNGKRSAAFTLFAAHDSSERYAWSVSPEKGFAAGMSVTLRQHLLGGAGDSVTLSGYLHEYLQNPWVRGHVLALLCSSGWSRGDKGFQTLYRLGGLPPQDIIAALINRQPLDFRGLRGFPPYVLSGNTYALLNAEYRFPIWYIHRGIETLPAVARRLWGTAFVDFGGAWFGIPQRSSLRWAAGTELAFSFSLALAFEGTLRLGFARGFGTDGENVFYFLLAP